MKKTGRAMRVRSFPTDSLSTLHRLGRSGVLAEEATAAPGRRNEEAGRAEREEKGGGMAVGCAVLGGAGGGGREEGEGFC